MNRIAIEAFDPAAHRNHLWEVPSPPEPRTVLIVRAGKFELQFLSQAQLDAAIAYFRDPSGSTRLDPGGGDHREFQPWQSRLPRGINNAHHRPRVLAALLRARAAAQRCLAE